ERATGERGVTLRVDAFGKAQSHQQKFIGLLPARQRVVGDKAVAERLHPHQPGLGTLFCGGSLAHATYVEPSMRARADAGIFMRAPVDEIVPAFCTRLR